MAHTDMQRAVGSIEVDSIKAAVFYNPGTNITRTSVFEIEIYGLSETRADEFSVNSNFVPGVLVEAWLDAARHMLC
jgi:hypothetical protein